jgi:Mg2+ and Co2+ transporter CorA
MQEVAIFVSQRFVITIRHGDMFTLEAVRQLLHWQFGYVYALGLMGMSSAVLWWRFRRSGWL